MRGFFFSSFSQKQIAKSLLKQALTFAIYKNMFPIESSLIAIKQALNENKDVILTAEPGAGKSTVVPLALMNENWLEGRKIVMLQPRRVAAVAVATRMSETDGSEPGKVIGHSVRFSSNIKPSTKIEVLTEGILTRRLQKDPFLEDVGLVIFDEFHERSIHADLCMALCREVKRDVRPDLRIMIMSATIDATLVSSYLDNPQVIAGRGFLYPVDIEYKPIGVGREYFDNAAEAVDNIVKSSAPDEEYLVFLPGIGEINRVRDYLESHTSGTTHDILTLYGSMNINDQQKALKPSGKPRVILSTNIAETSLTINGITTVVDTGYARQTGFDPQTGLNKLELKRISQASAKQRSGRAGRLKAGRAVRLWSKAEFDNFAADEIPEILRSDITSTILELYTWGVKDPYKFNWLEAPSNENITHSIDLLKMLGAITEDGQITELGRRMCETPAEPRLACMLINAERSGLIEEAALAAAIIGEKDFIESSDPDLTIRLMALGSNLHGKSYSKISVSDKSAAWRIRQVAGDLQKICKNTASKASDENMLFELLLKAFPDRVCHRRSKGGNSYTLCSGQGLSIDESSLLKEKEFILSLRQDSKLRATGDGKIFLACELKEEWLLNSEVAKKSRDIFFSEKSEKVCVRERIRYGSLLLKEQEAKLCDEDYEVAIECFCKAVLANPDKAFALEDKANKSFMGRLKALKSTSKGEEYPAIDEAWLKETLLSIATVQNLSFAWLQKQSISEIYFSTLSWKLREDFDKLVPERFRVPTGSNIRIDYTQGEQPVLPVKMQEMFGQATTPTICNGEISLIVHLLSPAGRPMQITSDLTSFWQNGYKSVVGELRGRYPKHSWPDNPATALPTRK